MHTKVGKYIISTVGEYYPIDSDEMEEIGLERFYETYVFHAKPDAYHECGCAVIEDYGHLDSMDANDASTAQKNHMKMIKKYWWLIALAALAYWKWDEIKAMFGKKDWSDSANPSGEVPTGTPLYTGDEAHSILPELNQDVNGDGVPDYLQGL